jgi:hypothetical protein
LWSGDAERPSFPLSSPRACINRHASTDMHRQT